MSQLTANKVARLLSGRALRYTVRILRKDGEEIEMQTMATPKLDWNAEARELFLQVQASQSYEATYPVIRWGDVATIVCEENPDYVKPKE